MSEFLTQFMERRGELLELTIEHMEMTSLAVLASLIVGGLIGIAITKNDKAAAIVIGIANLMQSIPSIGLLAFMVPFVGIGQKPAIIMVVIYALLPIIKNTYTGIPASTPNCWRLPAASAFPKPSSCCASSSRWLCRLLWQVSAFRQSLRWVPLPSLPLPARAVWAG